MREEALGLSDFIRQNLFGISVRRDGLRRRFAALIARMDRYDTALAQALLAEMEEGGEGNEA